MNWLTNFAHKALKVVSQNIPGKGISASVYYHLQKGKILFGNHFSEDQPLTDEQSMTANEQLEAKLKGMIEQFRKDPTTLTDEEKISLGVDLATFFYADLHFRRGWVVDAYREIYEGSSNNVQLQLDLWVGFY
jgi:hypothetical protein